jgi:hypothetical protein
MIVDYVMNDHKVYVSRIINNLTLTESQIETIIPLLYEQKVYPISINNKEIIKKSHMLSTLCNKEAITHNFSVLYLDILNTQEKVKLLCSFKNDFGTIFEIIMSLESNLGEITLMGKNTWSPPLYQVKKKVLAENYYNSGNNDIYSTYQIKVNHKIRDVEYARMLYDMNQDHYYEMIHWLINSSKYYEPAYVDTVLDLVDQDMFLTVCPIFLVRLLIKYKHHKDVIGSIIAKHSFFNE